MLRKMLDKKRQKGRGREEKQKIMRKEQETKKEEKEKEEEKSACLQVLLQPFGTSGTEGLQLAPFRRCFCPEGDPEQNFN